MTRLTVIALLLLALSAGAAEARSGDHGGRGGDEDVRVAGICGRGATSLLRLRSRDGGIEVRFQVRETRGRGLWRLAVVHERRVVARARRRTTSRDDSFELRVRVADLGGSDAVAVQAWGPGGIACRAATSWRDGK